MHGRGTHKVQAREGVPFKMSRARLVGTRAICAIRLDARARVLLLLHISSRDFSRPRIALVTDTHI